LVHDLEEATQLARTIKQQIRDMTKLTASAGVSYSKSLSKIASDLHKPDGLTTISLQQVPAFLDTLPIDQFFGVGRVTAAKLRQRSLETGVDLKRLGEKEFPLRIGCSFSSQPFRQGFACGPPLAVPKNQGRFDVPYWASFPKF
jgi:nucleotidyltransferase/DNA polymerase involved in DNA repair